MPIVRCNMSDCINNKNNCCHNDGEIFLDKFTEYTVECLDYETKEMLDLKEKMRSVLERR